jgi:hypothetical protein
VLQIPFSRSSATPAIAGCDSALLDIAGPLDNSHVLVIGHGALEAICALIRTGCAAATEAVADRPTAETADVVLVPRLSADTLARTVALTHRALLPGGRCVMAAGSELLARQAAALMRIRGFSCIRVRATADGTLVCAERPWFGPLAQPVVAARR